jgi:uncharacterized protein (TIGR03083 family)
MNARTESLKPILTAPLFSRLETQLVELLRSLGREDWEKQTVAPQWRVKDVAAHLLDTPLRGLSIFRDGYAPGPLAVTSHDELVALINRLNHEGVRVYRRLSPNVLISLMEVVSRELCAYHEALDPGAPSLVGVTWAGEEKSLNWFNTAREFTERWHHQQQIRLAVDKPGIMTREFYYPVLDCFMRALPFTYRTVSAVSGACARFNVSGDCGGSWYLYRERGIWQLIGKPFGDTISETTIPQEIAWRVFTKGIDRTSAMPYVRVSGDTEVGLHVLRMISIIG